MKSEQELDSVKPQIGMTKEQFEEQALIMLSKLDSMIKQCTANCKQYMIENDIDMHKNEHGKLYLDATSRNALDRNLIPDITWYYVKKKLYILRKTLF